jgi:hypothetical protein
LHWQWNLNGVALPGETNAELIIANAQRINAGSYTVSITNLVTGLSFTAPAATLSGPAVFLQQPISQNIRVGSNVTFSVMATGLAPVTIQWQRQGTNIAGATNNTLTFTNVQIPDDAAFTAAISNSYGTLLSSNANLVALARPLMAVQPLGQSVAAGGSVTFSAGATGHPLPLTFRWLKNGVAVSILTIADTNCFITFTNIQPPASANQYTYRVTVTNLAGSVSSANAIVTVLPDSDEDGLPDEWEIAHGLDAHESSDAPLDADGDGMTNRAEFLSGTEPNDPLSCLTLNLAVGASADACVLRWNALSNRTYRIEGRASVEAGGWSSFAQIMAHPTNGLMEIAFARSTNASARFYRIVTPNILP